MLLAVPFPFEAYVEDASFLLVYAFLLEHNVPFFLVLSTVSGDLSVILCYFSCYI